MEIAIRRHPHEIERELAAHQFHLSTLHRLAADFAARDFRPFVVIMHPDGTSEVSYARDLFIPPALTDMLTDEAETVARLTDELYDAGA